MHKRPNFVDELLDAKKKKLIVSVYYSDEDSDACATGRVLSASGDGITLEHFSKFGASDGRVLIRMDRISMVDVNGQYEKMIAFLAKHYDQVF